MLAWVSKSPIGADPGLWSLAIASAAPASNSLRAGVKSHPKPIEAPGSATEIVSLCANNAISVSPLASK